ncbi:MAG: ribulose-phosphate 3-epimerase [Deltaproteobacteria bacterium]|nr:ribulose-phosphate 3-epimerase [Deltaproteobacteria bacterium]
MKKIAPSILSADFSKLGDEIKAVEDGKADYIHIDVMDGHFVPNLTIGPFVVEAARRVTTLPLDVHLMIESPERSIPQFADAGSDIITVHAEACPHLHRTVQQIKELGVRAGVSLNPSTSVTVLDHILEELDLVLVMSVNPGFGGQQFIPSSLQKVREIRRRLDAGGCKAELEIDGGIKVTNIGEASRAGADVFVAGSAVFGSDDYSETIKSMKQEIRG